METQRLQPTAPLDWKSQLGSALRTATQLAEAGWIAPSEVAAYEPLLRRFPVVLPPYYAALIDRSDPHCPIRRQALPSLEELRSADGRQADPLEDLRHQPVPRVTHRYPGRALLHLTPNCSMACRYCFRKSLLAESRAEFLGGELGQAVEYFRRTASIREVIFSGGDPFLANETTLLDVLKALGQMPHLRRVRFHSRVPVTLPMRVQPAFARLLTASGKATSVVCHFNHPRELTDEAAQAVVALRQAGVTVFNQSVLLAGVNADAETLAALCEGLFDWGVIPYYLHHPDAAQGTQHFDVTPAQGLAVVESLKRRLPGYLVPRYVVDNPAFPYKRCVSTCL